METIIKPVWYFHIMEPHGTGRFFIGKVGYPKKGEKEKSYV